MYCKNCGSQIDDRAVVCPHCGVPVNAATSANNSGAQEGNTIAIVGFVLSFFFALVGLICSVMGYNKCKNEGAPYKGFAIAGIVISAVSMATALLAVIIVVATVGAVGATLI